MKTLAQLKEEHFLVLLELDSSLKKLILLKPNLNKLLTSNEFKIWTDLKLKEEKLIYKINSFQTLSQSFN